MDLTTFIENYLTLAGFRNLDSVTPIKFTIQPDNAKPNRTFIVVVAMTEPTFSQLPYNVLWIPGDSDHPAFGTVLKRTSHSDSGLYSNTWATVATYEDLWVEDQYYLSVVEDPRLHGITTAFEETGPATRTSHGLVVLSAPEVESRVVSHSDPRNTDERYPTQHTHPDYPRTMIKINANEYALVDTSAPPQQGMMLVLIGQNLENPNEWIASWKFITEEDIIEEDDSLIAIVINGPNSVEEKTSGQLYTVTAYFANGTTSVVTPTTFTSGTPAVASIDTAGNIETFNVTNNTPLTLSASYTHEGITANATKDITVTTGLEVVSLEIIGADEVDENTTSQYIIRATYSDSSTSDVVADSVTSSLTSYATVNSTALLTAQEVNGGDKNTTLSASYTYDGVTVTADKVVTIVDLDPLVTEIVIIGADTLGETSTTTYSFKLVYSDGSEVQPATPDSFIQLSSTYSTLSGYDLTAGSLDSDQTVRLEATFTEYGRTVTGFKDVILTNNPPAAVSAAIVGATNVSEGATSNYILRVTYDDASTQDFTDATWAVDSGGTYASINATGVLTAGSVDTDQPVTISAEKTIDGVTVSDTHNLTIVAAVPTSLTMAVSGGATEFAENDTVVITYTVGYSDGSTANVKASPDLSVAFNGDAQGSTFTGANSNDVLYGAVSGSITVNGSYTENGTTVNDSLELVAEDLTISPRWGLTTRANTQADFATEEFYNALTNELAGTNGEQFTTPGDLNDMYEDTPYIMIPASLAHIYIVNTGTNLSGGWDAGAVTQGGDAEFATAEVTIAGQTYYVYSPDAPLGDNPITWELTYNTSSGSGNS
ncbi:T1SS secreted agglutinin RTX [Phage NCTB]|nr:T1SS secreted agglutinin RTX [Phage NCTB]